MRVYAVQGAPPEIQAYGLAKYSRSAQSLEESIDELSTQRAEQFLNTFYFQYGHASIADLAHVTLALENISMLAAFHVVDEPLWDGQGRSSRYQNFRSSGFYIPPELEGTPSLAQYQAALEFLLGQYERFSAALMDVLKAVIPCPAEMTPATYTRKLRARAFDVARYFLPLATLTSNGQVTSARTLERQISRLAGHPLTELHAISAAMKAACQTPGYNFVERRLGAAWELGNLAPEQVEDQRHALAEAGVIASGAVPTLVKYTAADTYEPETLAAARALLQPYLAALDADPDTRSSAGLIPAETDLLDALTLELLYLSDTRGRGYAQLAPVAQSLPLEVKRQLFEVTVANRGPHDDWLRQHRLGYALGFDLLVDFGSLRDLHRHRRCVQILPELKLDLGCDDADTIFTAALGAQGAALAAEQGLISAFDGAMARALATAQGFPERGLAAYLLPLGAKQRALFKMDLAEAAYMIEQRSRVGGHFSYRRVAYEMYLRLSDRYPWVAGAIRASNPAEEDDPLAR